MNARDALVAAREMGVRNVVSRVVYEAMARSGLYARRFRPYEDTAADPSPIYRDFHPSLVPSLDRSRLMSFYEQHPSLREACLAQADEIAAGRIRVYDRCVDLSDSPFTTDPQTGRPWPVGPHGSTYPLRQEGLGDVKYVWELNNFHFALPLAQAAVLTDDARYYECFTRLAARWMEENAGQRTVNWSSNLEIGLRLCFWCWARELFQQAPSFAHWSAADSEESSVLLRLARSLHAQLRYMFTHLWFTESCVGMDHILGDLLTMIYVLRCYPRLPEAARLERLCLHLEREFRAQFSPDGVYGMISLNYQRYATEFLLAYLHLRPDLPEARRAPLVQIARRSLRFLAAFSDDRSASVRFGENDGAHLLRLGRGSRNDFGALFLWAQASLGEAAPKQYRPEAQEAVAWLNLFPEPPTAAIPTGTASFGEGEYWSYRDPQVSLWVRTGRLHPRPIGQADQLTYSLSLEGRPVVVQPGTGLYNGPSDMRDYFRGARSHSGLCLDGRPPMQPWGRFRWVRSARGRGAEAARGDDWVLFAGRHDGFDALGVTHRRLFLVMRERGVAVVDCLSGQGTHRVERGLHLAAPPEGLTLAGVEAFQVAADRWGMSPTYGETVCSHLLTETTARELPWLAAYWIGRAGEPVRVENAGTTAEVRIGPQTFRFAFRGGLLVLLTSSGEVEISEGTW